MRVKPCAVRVKRSEAKALSIIPQAHRLQLFKVIDLIDRLLPYTEEEGAAAKVEFEGFLGLRVGFFRIVYEVM